MSKYGIVGLTPSASADSLVWSRKQRSVKGVRVYDIGKRTVVWVQCTDATQNSMNELYKEVLAKGGLNYVEAHFSSELGKLSGNGTMADMKVLPNKEMPKCTAMKEGVPEFCIAARACRPVLSKVNGGTVLAYGAVVLDEWERDIEPLSGQRSFGRCFRGRIINSHDEVPVISVMFWGPEKLRQGLKTGIPYVVMDANYNDSHDKFKPTLHVAADCAVLPMEQSGSIGVRFGMSGGKKDPTPIGKARVMADPSCGIYADNGGGVNVYCAPEDANVKAFQGVLEIDLLSKMLNKEEEAEKAEVVEMCRDGTAFGEEGIAVEELWYDGGKVTSVRMALGEHSTVRLLSGPTGALAAAKESKDAKGVTSEKEESGVKKPALMNLQRGAGGNAETEGTGQRPSRSSVRLTGKAQKKKDEVADMERRQRMRRRQVLEDEVEEDEEHWQEEASEGKVDDETLPSGRNIEVDQKKERRRSGKRAHSDEDEEGNSSEAKEALTGGPVRKRRGGTTQQVSSSKRNKRPGGKNESSEEEEALTGGPTPKERPRTKQQVAPAGRGGKKYQVEAFLDMSVDDEDQPIVKVKYEQYDDAEWQPLKYMKKELGTSAYQKFLTEMREGKAKVSSEE